MSVNKPLITFITIAALSLLSAGAAVAASQNAGEADALPVAAPVSTAQRSDVQAATAAFVASGAPSPWSSQYSNATQRVAAPQPRAAVKAEVLAARANDSLIVGGEVLSVDHPFVRVPASSTVAALQR